MKITVDTNKLLRQMEILAAVYKRLQVIEDNLTTLGNKKDWEDIYDGIAEHIKHDIYSYSYDVSQFLTVLGGLSKFIEISCSKYNEVDQEISEGKELIAYNDTKGNQINVSGMTKSISTVESVNVSTNMDATKGIDGLNLSKLTQSEKVRLTAVDWAIQIANDDVHHGYSQANRGKPQTIDGEIIVDYDCSSFVCTAFKEAGVNMPILATNGMIANGCASLISAGFTLVTESINSENGDGFLPGDIVLKKGHVEMITDVKQEGNKTKVELTGAHGGKDDINDYNDPGDSTGNEISSKWVDAVEILGEREFKYVLRFCEN